MRTPALLCEMLPLASHPHLLSVFRFHLYSHPSNLHLRCADELLSVALTIFSTVSTIPPHEKPLLRYFPQKEYLDEPRTHKLIPKIWLWDDTDAGLLFSLYLLYSPLCFGQKFFVGRTPSIGVHELVRKH